MDVRYDRTGRVYYDNASGRDLSDDEVREHFAAKRYEHNPDGTSNDRP